MPRQAPHDATPLGEQHTLMGLALALHFAKFRPPRRSTNVAPQFGQATTWDRSFCYCGGHERLPLPGWLPGWCLDLPRTHEPIVPTDCVVSCNGHRREPHASLGPSPSPPSSSLPYPMRNGSMLQIVKFSFAKLSPPHHSSPRPSSSPSAPVRLLRIFGRIQKSVRSR